jgi:hypothetical protein
MRSRNAGSHKTSQIIGLKLCCIPRCTFLAGFRRRACLRHLEFQRIAFPKAPHLGAPAEATERYGPVPEGVNPQALRPLRPTSRSSLGVYPYPLVARYSVPESFKAKLLLPESYFAAVEIRYRGYCRGMLYRDIAKRKAAYASTNLQKQFFRLSQAAFSNSP